MPRVPNRVVGERAPARTRSLRLLWGRVRLAPMRQDGLSRRSATPMRAVLQLFFPLLRISATPSFFLVVEVATRLFRTQVCLLRLSSAFLV